MGDWGSELLLSFEPGYVITSFVFDALVWEGRETKNNALLA